MLTARLSFPIARENDPMPLALAQINNLLLGFLVVFFIVVSIAMILIVLIQRPQGGGLSGAFGAASDGAGQTAFGAKTGDMLTYATVGIFLVFLGFAIGLNYVVTDSIGPAPENAGAAEVEDAGTETQPDSIELQNFSAPGSSDTAPETPSDAGTTGDAPTDEGAASEQGSDEG